MCFVLTVFPPWVTKLGSMSPCTCIFNVSPHPPEHRQDKTSHPCPSAPERQNLALLPVEVRERLSVSQKSREVLRWLGRRGEHRQERWSPVWAPHSGSCSSSQAWPREGASRTPWTEPTARPCSCASCRPRAAPTRSASFPSPTRQELLWF